jgi:hypothetical protein
VTFCLVQELNGAEHARSYGVVTCMETLEHCTDSTVDSVWRTSIVCARAMERSSSAYPLRQALSSCSSIWYGNLPCGEG